VPLSIYFLINHWVIKFVFTFLIYVVVVYAIESRYVILERC